MSYKVTVTNKFKRSIKKCKKRGLDLGLLKEVISHLSENGEAPQKCRPHKLVGEYKGMWECHIMAEWLLVWDQDDKELKLLLIDTGSHSDIF